jgi:hypothetical protein
MSEDRCAEIVLPVLDKWFREKAEQRYGRDEARLILSRMEEAERLSMWPAREPLKEDFRYTFPHRENYFTWLYGRREGYLGSPQVGIDEEDTLVLGTLAPVYSLIRKMGDLSSKVRKIAGERSPSEIADNEIDRAFAETFRSLDEFTDFCTSYLRTRLLAADARTTQFALDEISYEIQARNFAAVRDSVWAFAYMLFGDKIQ